MEKIAYGGWDNCIRLENSEIELVVTTDVGPRVMVCRFKNGKNLLKEYKDQLGRTSEKQWLLYGGHRLWHAPEADPRSYWPDNVPVAYEGDGTSVKLMQPVEETTRVEKQMEITLDAGQNRVTLLHRLINRNLWDIQLAAWCPTVCAEGGRCIIPQEEYRSHPEYLLPARPVVLWHYTNMSDPRWTWGEKYIQLRQDGNAKTKQKVGLYNSLGWVAYARGDDVLIKRFPVTPGAEHPDFGCNTETFTDPDMIEVETLGPMVNLVPDQPVEFTEEWYLFKSQLGTSDAELDKTLLPLVEKTDSVEA